ncbi:DNA-directed RNA polymerase subunit E'' [Candidatus Woesearchaeota archaeon]|jgi:RNA polymerase subunit RPABC4/transcription elongation factor Spt4|nr:DNA-directed RNA polymerase subunit E'' [Candidatus Woesearchaeota archaeon]MBT4387993.1 DNA-directed RNA polymerase subunit E'' [Candidatus Woesearchaeota archaeon]MBT4595337.1 DNA-directed RNA polymerase subunit E'' [Candidatus Woesearchaeota archaeon]MBT5741258.1 DNA-directed RNA polymerase subunit E'' [Candidatus Woesearchaeota archaeon]MBT6505846.1 DNA-directed RNA polymerase subunit E'' [Candidatus Woesearchaeota archaeon]
MKKLACKNCNYLYSGTDPCPNCKSQNPTDDWKGKVIIVNSEKSDISKYLKKTKNGEFSIKVR